MKEAKNDWTEFNTTEPTELAEMTDKTHLKKDRQFYEMYPLSGLALTYCVLMATNWFLP